MKILTFSHSFKIEKYFAYKDPIPNDLKSFLIYKFTCASCSSSYIAETFLNNRHPNIQFTIEK